MRNIPVNEAVGETICHDMTAIWADGSKGVQFKRGHVIREEDIPVLLDMGKRHIYAWEPDAGEMHEDDAALAVTKAVCGPNISFTGPTEGKYQIQSQVNGLFKVNSSGLRAVNSVPDFTIACLPSDTVVAPGDKLAGARIVPLVTKRENVEAAVLAASEAAPVLYVKPFLAQSVGVIITGSEVYEGRIEDKFEPIIRKKTDSLGGRVLGVTKCPDELETIVDTIAEYKSRGATIIVLSGGMSVDPDDLTPAAIRLSGAEIVTHGVPMQPGNMLMLAYLSGTALIGVPGASIHSRITSLDVVLPRIFAGETLAKEDLAGMGEGGFCLMCEECRYPVCYFGRG